MQLGTKRKRSLASLGLLAGDTVPRGTAAEQVFVHSRWQVLCPERNPQQQLLLAHHGAFLRQHKGASNFTSFSQRPPQGGVCTSTVLWRSRKHEASAQSHRAARWGGWGWVSARVLTTKLSKLSWRGNSPALPTVPVRWLVFAGP